MEKRPKDEEGRTSADERGRHRLAKDLAGHIADQKQRWGDIDNMLLANYLSGLCTEDEKARVDKAMKDYPAVRECVELVRHPEEPEPGKPEPESMPKRGCGKPWIDRVGDSKDDPGTAR